MQTQTRARRFAGLAIAGIFVVLAIAMPAMADTFELKSGKKLDGSIVREIGDLVSIKTTDGKIVTIERSDIVATVKRRTAFDDYRERSDKLAADDASAQFEMAKWCEKHMLTSQAKYHYKVVIRLEPFNTEARLALGYVSIAGDWYLAGSPEAEARLAEVRRIDRAPHELPKDLEKATAAQVGRRKRTPPPSPSSTPTSGQVATSVVQLVLDERLGSDAPKSSLTTYRLAELFSSLDPPMSVNPIDPKQKPADGLLLEVKVRSYFVKKELYYGRVALFNVYKGEAEAVLYQVKDGQKKVLMKQARFSEPFSSSVQNKRETALEYCYVFVVDALMVRLSRLGYFKERGARPIQPMS